MRISKLMMPALTLAGALALAGCGGGSSTPGTGGEEGDEDDPPVVCKGPGVTLNADNECVENPDTTSAAVAEDRDDALALYAAIGPELRDLVPIPRGSAAPKKNDQTKASLVSEGEMFKVEYDTETTAANARAGNLRGYYSISTDGSAEADLDDSLAKSPSFGKAKAVEHEPGTVSGSYNGVDGTFRCSSDDCTSQTRRASAEDADGELVLAGTWYFKPDSDSERVTGDTQAEWGWWIQRAVAGDTINVYITTTTAGGGQISSVTGANLGTLASTATYSGKAAGQYAIHDPTGTGSDSGHFTADAALTATFGASATDSLVGKIEDFKVTDDAEPRNWTVDLESATSGDLDGTHAADFIGKTVWTIDRDKSLDKGDWQADMYREGTDGTVTTEVPEIVLGSFGASHSDIEARMIGTFGAKAE